MPLHFSPQTKRVFHLSLPIFAELLLQLLVGNMDQFMIAHFGSAAVASIGNGNQVMNVVIIVLTTMSTASTILLTQHIGAGRTGEECDEIATVGMTVIAVFSFAVGLFLLLDPEVLFRLLRTPEDAFAGACLYTRIVGGGVLLQGLYIELCAILRDEPFERGGQCHPHQRLFRSAAVGRHRRGHFHGYFQGRRADAGLSHAEEKVPRPLFPPISPALPGVYVPLPAGDRPALRLGVPFL